MAKYIDIDGLKPIKVFLSVYAEEPILVYKKEDIDRRTVVDVKPVVMCKDCKYSSFVPYCSKYECCRLPDMLFSSEYFCSNGKNIDE